MQHATCDMKHATCNMQHDGWQMLREKMQLDIPELHAELQSKVWVLHDEVESNTFLQNCVDEVARLSKVTKTILQAKQR